MTKKLSKILSICVFSAILIALLIFGSFFLFDDDKKDQFQNNEITSTATGFWTDTGNWAVPTKRTMIGTTYYAYIETPQHLAWLSYRVNSENGDDANVWWQKATFIQTADLDLSAHMWEPIGSSQSETPGNPFRGTYDGGGFAISGLGGYQFQGTYKGLFGYTVGATIKNVVIKDDNNTSPLLGGGVGYFGAVVGYASSTTIYNCHNYCDIIGPQSGFAADELSCTGGIVGKFIPSRRERSISYCSNHGSINDDSYLDVSYESQHLNVGGIVGYVKTSSTGFSLTADLVLECYNEGEIFASEYVGGIAGRFIANTSTGCTFFIVNCYNIGNIHIYGYYGGGIVGFVNSSYDPTRDDFRIGGIQNCYNIGNLYVYVSYAETATTNGGLCGVTPFAKNSFSYAFVGRKNTPDGGGYGAMGIGTVYCCFVPAIQHINYIYLSPYDFFNDSLFGSMNPYNRTFYYYSVEEQGSINSAFKTISLSKETLFDESWYTNADNWDTTYPWDFESVWAIDENINYGLPHLQPPEFSLRVYENEWFMFSSPDVDFESAVWQEDERGRYKEVKVDAGTQVTLTGEVNENGYFSGWGRLFAGSQLSNPVTISTDITTTITVNTDMFIAIQADEHIYETKYYYRKNDGSTSGFSQPHSGSFVILGADEVDDMYDQNGWVFYSWGRTRSAVTGSLPGQSISSSSNASLFAISNRDVTVSYDGNGGTYSGEDTTGLQRWNQYGNALQSSAMTITSTVPTRPGYVFKGWSADSSATEPTYTSGASFTFTSAYNEPASVTMFAVWESDILTITLEMGGGTSSVGVVYLKYSDGFYLSQNCTEGTKFTALNVSSLPKRTGYTFEGYYTEDGILIMDKYGMVQTNRDEFTTTDTTIYAHWEVKNEAKFDEEKGYWYLEMGSIPQTRLEDEVKIAELDEKRANFDIYNSSLFFGFNITYDTYLLDNEEYAYIILNSEEVMEDDSVEEIGRYYLVEPVRFILSGDYTEGNAVDDEKIMAITEDIVYMLPWMYVTENSLGLGQGYLDSDLYGDLDFYVEVDFSLFLEDYYLTTIDWDLNIKNFKTADGENVVENPKDLSCVLSSKEDMDEVFGDGNYAVKFSDLVTDLLGGNLLYYTRDVGSNLGNAECISAGGKTGLQAKMTEILGVRITVCVETFVCLE